MSFTNEWETRSRVKAETCDKLSPTAEEHRKGALSSFPLRHHSLSRFAATQMDRPSFIRGDSQSALRTSIPFCPSTAKASFRPAPFPASPTNCA